MKHASPADQALIREGDIPVPRLHLIEKRRYLILLSLILLCAAAVLVIILSSPALHADEPPAPSTTQPPAAETTPPTEIPSTQAPAVDDLLASAPPADTSAPETPPVIVENIVLSGSIGLLYHSYGDGSCRVESVGDCTDACILVPERSPEGDVVIGIAPNAFAGCEQLVAVQLPASVTTVGECAFADCPRMVCFVVSEENPAFCARDGVLLTRDGSALLSYPAGRSCPVAVIPAEVSYISDHAFCATSTLTAIRYEGSLSAWRTLSIGEGNEVLYTLPKTFGSQ